MSRFGWGAAMAAMLMLSAGGALAQSSATTTEAERGANDINMPSVEQEMAPDRGMPSIYNDSAPIKDTLDGPLETAPPDLPENFDPMAQPGLPGYDGPKPDEAPVN